MAWLYLIIEAMLNHWICIHSWERKSFGIYEQYVSSIARMTIRH